MSVCVCVCALVCVCVSKCLSECTYFCISLLINFININKAIQAEQDDKNTQCQMGGNNYTITALDPEPNTPLGGRGCTTLNGNSVK